MLKNILRKRKLVERAKCIKCGKREVEREGQMCKSCRYMLTLENIVKGQK